MVVREQKKRYKMCGRGIRGLKAKVKWKCCISRVGPDLTVEVCKLEESEEKVTVLLPDEAGMQQREQLQE